MPKTTLRTLILIWLGWFIVLYGFQSLVVSRLGLMRPDHAVPWSAAETTALSNRGKIYLLEPLMNKQVAWDSEYYLGIAVGGYDDPKAGRVKNPETGEFVIKNYSFFPFYPILANLALRPFMWLGLNTIAAGTAGGLVVTLLGTLAGMIALWLLSRDLFGEESAYRSVFYLLIFPTSFFFAMVYTEGIFIGLAFWALLLIRRKQWLLASVLAVMAAWTRAHGAALALPLVWAWVASVDRDDIQVAFKNWRWWTQGLAAVLPLGAYFYWRLSPFGQGWAELQSFYFGRGLFSLSRTIDDIKYVYEYAQTNSQAAVYFGIEAGSVLLALVACLWLIKYDRPIALFGLAVVLLSVFSGSAQSLARYMLIAPPLYLFLARLGRSQVFDRVWTIASILLLGMSAMLFAFDFWVG